MDPDLAAELRAADPVVLGQRIRRARVAQGLTQPELASGKFTVSYVSRIESGQRRPGVKMLAEFAERLQTTVEHLVTGISPARADELALVLLHAELALESGDSADSSRVLAGVLDDAESLPLSTRRKASFLYARCLEVGGQYDEAIIELERLVGEGDLGTWALRPLIALSRCYRESGDLTRAIEVGESGLAALAAAQVDGGAEAIQLTVTVASAYFERGDVGHAVRMAREAARRADEMDSPAAQAAAYWNASIYESERGGLVPAIALAERALELLGEGDDRRNRARLRIELGLMLLRLDPPELDEAERYLTRSRRELAKSSGSLIDVAACEVGLAQARLAANDLDAATDFATSAAAATRDKAPTIAAGAVAVLGRVAAARGDVAVAGQQYRLAVGLLTGVGQDRAAAQLWLDLGAELEAIGDGEAARDAFRRAAVASGLQIPSVIRRDAPLDR